ncbi:MAG TPA: response regulator [Candidatus Gastranaerophilaceae bacterium]|nr:response regulator [Candidatus Gastranaerophilaceae bacterium]HPT41356.1 response regulator [Candidatus Gastranaerophilaceae bacterium]
MTNQIQTVIIDTQTQSTDVLKLFLKELDYVQILDSFVDVVEGYNYILENRPNLVIVDISNKTELALDIINKISLNHKTCKIIVTSSNYSTDLIIKAMRAGAREFLPKPLIKEELKTALEKLKEQIAGLVPENNRCRVITVFSNKGGIGKTALSTNLALEIANITKEKVALIDLNLQLGDITTFLDINPAFDISYVIQNLSRIDETFLLSTLEKYKDTSLYVLADPPYLEQAEDISAEQISTLFSVLRQTFSYIVVDTSASFDGKTITALDNSDLILLVAIVNLPAIRNCQRCLELFERLGYEKEKIKIVLNRYMENDEIKVEDVEDVLEQKVFWKIPNNYFTIMSAINKGVPVNKVGPDANITQSYKELAAMLSDNIYKHSFAKKVERKPFFDFKSLFK